MELWRVMMRVNPDKHVRLMHYIHGNEVTRGTQHEITNDDFYEELYKHCTVHAIDSDSDGLVIGICDPENPELLEDPEYDLIESTEPEMEGDTACQT